MNDSILCRARDCGQPGVSRLQQGAYCRDHFIQTCYAQMDEYARQVHERRLRDSTTESLRLFLRECSRQAVELAEGADGLDNLERARLLDILLRATDLSQYLRRSPRKAAWIPIRVRCEKLGRRWEEDTETQMVSRYGAMVQLRNGVAADEILTVEWPAKSKQARARVAWSEGKTEGPSAVGFEFLDTDNFWEMDWTLPPSDEA
jgi:hypothetical protein